MREIKFRFWDKKTSKYYYRHPLTNDFTHPEIVAEQFIGLHDKNGKEIYEGDAVKAYGAIGVIRFKFGIFGIEYFDTSIRESLQGSWGQKHDLRRIDDKTNEIIEIIGNIHQNPELL